MTTKPLDDHTPDNANTNKINQDTNLANIVQWRCMNCGQHIFAIIDTEPPDICEYCEDMTTWQCIQE